MATQDNDHHQQYPEDELQTQGLSCASSAYPLAVEAPHPRRQPVLLPWGSFAPSNSAAVQAPNPPAAAVAASACESQLADRLANSTLVGIGATTDTSPPVTVAFSLTGGRNCLNEADQQQQQQLEASAPTVSDAAAAATGMHASVPFFSLNSEPAPLQQDVVLVSAGGGAAAAAGEASAAQFESDGGNSEKAAKPSMELELLECGVCMERMEPPIFQCREGHTLCCSCRQRLSSCPTCRSPELNIRCRALELLTQCLTDVPCRFADFGCPYTMKYSEVLQHETRCLRRPLACLHADSGCAFEASPQHLAEHLLQQHGYEYRPTSTIQFTCTPSNCRGSRRLGRSGKSCSTTHSSCPQAAQQVVEPADSGGDAAAAAAAASLDGCESFVWQQQLYHCFGKYFVLRIHRKVEGEASFYVSLLALHPRHHCSRYSLQVSGNHRTYSFHGPVWSALRGPKELERVKDCLLLPENIALFLSGAKGSEQNLNSINLSITGEILPS